MMQAEPGIPQSCSIFSGRAPQPPRPSRRWGAGTALIVLVAVLGIATPEDAQAAVPGKPQRFVVGASDTQAALRWEPPASDGGTAITSYEYRHAEGTTVPPSTTWAPPIFTGGEERTFWGAAVSGLTNGTKYTFQVRAVNSDGPGLPADPAKTTTVSVTPPPSPVGPEITLSWGAWEAGLEPSSFTLTITFSEEVNGFELNDINIITNSDSKGDGIQSGGEKGDVLLEILAKTTYSVEVTPVPAHGHSAQAVSVFIFRNRVKTVDGGIPNEQKVQLIDLTDTGTSTGASTDATLSALTLEDASNDFSIALSPPFASGTMSYMASVDNDVDEITIKPTVNESNATFEYQDSSNTKITDANSVKAGQQVSLSEGANTIKVKVTAQDDTTTDAYTVVVTRGSGGTTPITSTDATLSALALSNASNDSAITISPTFAAGTTSYTASVDNDVDEITITPTVNESNATVKYQDSSNTEIADADGVKTGQQVSLSEGANTIEVKVTAQDTTTTRTYTVVVIRAEPEPIPMSDATLRSLALSNAADDSPIALRLAFAPSILDYTASVANSVAQITIAPTRNNNGASVAYFDGSDVAIPDADDAKSGQQVPLVVGENTIKVQVTAQDTTTIRTYTVTVTRAEIPISDATLSALALSNAADDSPIALRPAFASGIIRYTASVANGVEQITIAPTRTIAGAIIAYLNGSDTAIPDADTTKAGQQVPLAVGANTIKVQVTAEDDTTMQIYTVTVTRRAPVTDTGTGGQASRGSGGGGGGSSQDEHGNTPAQATLVTLDPTRTASVPGQINTAADVDYFSVDVPYAGVLVVETSGPTATMGTVWQDEAELATANSGGVGRNFRLSVRVAPGSVVIAVAGNGRQTGRYTLQVTFLPGYLENPGAASFQSGIGVISGWTCDADEVEITLNGEPQEAAYGTDRLDTAGVCGDSDNGFGLLFNWNLLEDGEHEVVALVDGVELDRATVTVTTLGAEFLHDATGTCTAADFPTMDETVTLAWQQTQQNFVIAEGAAPAGTTNRTGTPGMGYLENPGPNSFQSGIGVLSGWACEGEEVVIELNGAPQPAAYGTERLDTEEACGDTANGFGLLFNWNLLGEGEHEVVAYVDGEELGRATVRVTTLGAEFVRGVTGECMVEDFPMLGETVTLEWQQNSQNFVITEVEGGSTL